MKPITLWTTAAALIAGLALTACREAQPPAPTPDSARELLATPEPFARLAGWAALLEHAGPDDSSALREALAGAPLDVGDPEVVAFAMWWARFDPAAALAWTDREWRAKSRLVVAAVFRVWAHEDPELAMKGIPKVAEFYHDAALDAVIAGWTESGKPGLLEHAKALPDVAFQQRFGDILARRLVLAHGADESLRMIEASESPEFREMMTIRIASAATEQGDGTAIAAWAASRVTSGEEQPSGFPRRIGTRWILSDPDGALAWLASLPAGMDRDDGVMESYRDWMRFSPAAALEWARNTEVQPWSEPAFSIYARILARENPEQALDLVSRFSDETLRLRVATVIALKWAARDRAAAEAWLARSELPAEVKARVSQGRPKT